MKLYSLIKKIKHKLFSIQKVNPSNVEFDPEFYLVINPDVRKSGVDPWRHYLEHGRSEGRMAAPPKLNPVNGFFPKIDRLKETILIVNHEASLTGAPVVGLNLTQKFSEKYNVFVVNLGGGSIEQNFVEAGALVVNAPYIKSIPLLADYLLRQLNEISKIKCAIVNSIESQYFLQSLASEFIPNISLIHEFSSYTRPSSNFYNALIFSQKCIFSSPLTYENAIQDFPTIEKSVFAILPQGQCLIPKRDKDSKTRHKDQTLLRSKIRPAIEGSRELVILGAGYVQYRKGVDLFIECANKIIKSNPEDKFRFIWIGGGYDQANGVGYSVYLADQINRAGLQNHIFIIDETDEIEVAYEEADLFLLTSRLDPLPNVAIDVMAHGVPLICFDRASGIATALLEGGVHDCVVDFLNVDAMASRVLDITSSRDRLHTLGGDVKKLASIRFNFDDYVEKLDAMMSDSVMQMHQEKRDVEVILESGLLNKNFYAPEYMKEYSIQDIAKRYVRSWAVGWDRRKPFPGFHPGIYKDSMPKAQMLGDPFAHYIRSGCPQGPWLNKVISPSKLPINSDFTPHKVALHIHAYFPELLEEIFKRLTLNQVKPDIFISVKSQEDLIYSGSIAGDYGMKPAAIKVVPNCGRDIGPMLTLFGSEIINNYEIIGHMHTKKSLDVGDLSLGQRWYFFLLENLLGGVGGAMADLIVDDMLRNPSIGIVFPDDPNVIGWTDNRDIAMDFAKRLKFVMPETFLSFPVGTMFWIRSRQLKPFVQLGLDWDDYPKEPLPYDGTILHALERLFSLSESNMNSNNVAVTHIKGIGR